MSVLSANIEVVQGDAVIDGYGDFGFFKALKRVGKAVRKVSKSKFFKYAMPVASLGVGAYMAGGLTTKLIARQVGSSIASRVAKRVVKKRRRHGRERRNAHRLSPRPIQNKTRKHISIHGQAVANTLTHKHINKTFYRKPLIGHLHRSSHNLHSLNKHTPAKVNPHTTHFIHRHKPVTHKPTKPTIKTIHHAISHTTISHLHALSKPTITRPRPLTHPTKPVLLHKSPAPHPHTVKPTITRPRPLTHPTKPVLLHKSPAPHPHTVKPALHHRHITTHTHTHIHTHTHTHTHTSYRLSKPTITKPHSNSHFIIKQKVHHTSHKSNKPSIAIMRHGSITNKPRIVQHYSSITHKREDKMSKPLVTVPKHITRLHPLAHPTKPVLLHKSPAPHPHTVKPTITRPRPLAHPTKPVLLHKPSAPHPHTVKPTITRPRPLAHPTKPNLLNKPAIARPSVASTTVSHQSLSNYNKVVKEISHNLTSKIQNALLNTFNIKLNEYETHRISHIIEDGIKMYMSDKNCCGIGYSRPVMSKGLWIVVTDSPDKWKKVSHIQVNTEKTTKNMPLVERLATAPFTIEDEDGYVIVYKEIKKPKISLATKKEDINQKKTYTIPIKGKVDKQTSERSGKPQNVISVQLPHIQQKNPIAIPYNQQKTKEDNKKYLLMAGGLAGTALLLLALKK